MKMGLALRYLVLGGALTWGGLSWGVPHWKYQVGLDRHPSVGQNSSPDQLKRKGVSLRQEAEDTYRRLEIKHQLIQDLIEDRVALAEVITCFESLNTNTPAVQAHVIDWHPGQSQREWAMFAILNYLEVWCRDDPATHERILDRLEQEWSLLQHGSTYPSPVFNSW